MNGVILNTPSIPYQGDVIGDKQELINKMTKIKIKITNRKIIEYIRKYQFTTRNQKNMRIRTKGPNLLPRFGLMVLLPYFRARNKSK